MTISKKLRGMKLPPGYNACLLLDAADEIDRLTRENSQLAEFVEAVGGFWGHTKSALVGPESLAEAINGMAEENLRLTRERDEARAERDALAKNSEAR